MELKFGEEGGGAPSNGDAVFPSQKALNKLEEEKFLPFSEK